jgi:hypothetical protein
MPFKMCSLSLAIILVAFGFASPVCCQVGAGYFESDPFAANTQHLSFQDAVELSNRIPVTLRGEWITDADTSLSSYETAIKFPILNIFGSPPPIVRVGFDYTNLDSEIAGDFPEDLFEYSVGVSRVRRWTDRWVFRSSIGVAYATDNENRSSDAWQFRGSAFGIYQYNSWWQFSVGAIALGRRDLPVIPAIGAVWTPNSFTRVDLIPPIPTANFLLSDDGVRQRWLYTGFGFSGTTWAYQSPSLGDDVLTYRDLRLVVGWHSTPKPPPGIPYARGRKNRIEIGYAFSRELEFDDDVSSVDLNDSFLFRLSSDY